MLDRCIPVGTIPFVNGQNFGNALFTDLVGSLAIYPFECKISRCLVIKSRNRPNIRFMDDADICAQITACNQNNAHHHDGDESTHKNRIVDLPLQKTRSFFLFRYFIKCQ